MLPIYSTVVFGKHYTYFMKWTANGAFCVRLPAWGLEYISHFDTHRASCTVSSFIVYRTY